jgi:NADH-quinone oxidoreductase subunit C
MSEPKNPAVPAESTPSKPGPSQASDASAQVPPATPVAPEPVPAAPTASQVTEPDAEADAGQPQPPAQPPVPTRSGMWSDGVPDVSGYGGLVTPVERPGGEPIPGGSWMEAAGRRTDELVPGAISKAIWHLGELTWYVPRERLAATMRALRDDAHLRFEMCASVSGVHYPDDSGAELHVVYHLQSMTHNRRLRVETSCPDADPHVPSVVGTYPAADWHERETWDMFGVIFDGHPALTRILMPDDWVGHPQRKDYPLGGIPVEYKGAVVPPPDQRRNYR